MLLRCVVVGLIAVGATFASTQLDDVPPLPTLKLVSTEPVCASAAGVKTDLVVQYCFDPATLLGELRVPPH
jgi:hypothetical protein